MLTRDPEVIKMIRNRPVLIFCVCFSTVLISSAGNIIQKHSAVLSLVCVSIAGFVNHIVEREIDCNKTIDYFCAERERWRRRWCTNFYETKGYPNTIKWWDDVDWEKRNNRDKVKSLMAYRKIIIDCSDFLSSRRFTSHNPFVYYVQQEKEKLLKIAQKDLLIVWKKNDFDDFFSNFQKKSTGFLYFFGFIAFLSAGIILYFSK